MAATSATVQRTGRIDGAVVDGGAAVPNVAIVAVGAVMHDIVPRSRKVGPRVDLLNLFECQTGIQDEPVRRRRELR